MRHYGRDIFNILCWRVSLSATCVEADEMCAAPKLIGVLIKLGLDAGKERILQTIFLDAKHVHNIA